MFSPVQRCVCVLALVIAAAAVPAASAQGEGRTGAVALQNRSTVAIPIQMRLGTEGPWTDYTVSPSSNLNITFSLDRFGRTPLPHIRFENSKGTIKCYSLPFYEVEMGNLLRGKPYKFEYNSDVGWDLHTAD
jgi:hypothetical protein